MKISVCTDALFSGKNLVNSIKELDSIGVKSFEFWLWWDKELKIIKAAKDELGMDVVAFCTKFISLVDATKHEEYFIGLKESINAAQFMGCKNLITHTGSDNGLPRETQHENLVKGLKACVPFLEESGITLLIEPLNLLVDHAGYYLSSSLEGFEIIDKVGSPYVKLLFDVYHQQISGGNLISNITKNIDKIGHFHAAGNPGRHELFPGEIHYPDIFKAIENIGYTGYIGLEYSPVEEPLKGIKALLNH